jgi:hypothetical protein
MTVAQKALNLAQRASPIGLIIAGVTLLVGLLVLAYKRSDTFRSIVNKAMAVAKAGVDKAVGAFKALGPTVQRIMQFVARVVGVYVKVYVTAFQLGLRAATAAWNGVRDVVSGVVGFVTTKVGNAKDDLVGAWNTIRRAGKAAFNALIAPVQHIIDLVQGLLDKIGSIHLPHVNLPGFRPMLPGGGGRSPGSSSPSSPSGSSPQKLISNVYNYVFNITLTGTASPSDADALMRAVDARLRSQSKRPVFS